MNRNQHFVSIKIFFEVISLAFFLNIRFCSLVTLTKLAPKTVFRRIGKYRIEYDESRTEATASQMPVDEKDVHIMA